MGVCTISQTTHLILMTMMMKTLMLMGKMKGMHKQILHMTLLDLTNCQQKKEKKDLHPFNCFILNGLKLLPSLKSTPYSTVFCHAYLIVLEMFGGCTDCER